jgi:uncharacterized protein YigE (DUF2233 family)
MRALFLAALLVTACSPQPAAPEPQSACRQQAFEGSTFTVCDPQGGQLLLFAAAKNEQPLRSFADIATRIDPRRVAFAMNAGMFDQDGRPIGLAIVNGREVHKINLRKGGGNFHLLPNGVLVVLADGKSAIFESSKLAGFRAAPQLATQSGPMLVINGKLHPKLDRDGPSRYVRNGVGVRRDGRPLFVISEDAVSFGKLARFFRDSLHTPNALYFDGTVSSLWDPANGRQDAHTPLGPIIVVLKAR